MGVGVALYFHCTVGGRLIKILSIRPLVFKPNHGVWAGEQLIDSTFTAKAVRPRFEKGQQYGYGWWLGDVDGKSFFSMRGHLGQYVIVFPEDDVVIVRLGHRGMPDLPNSDTPADLPLFVHEAFQMLAPDNET